MVRGLLGERPGQIVVLEILSVGICPPLQSVDSGSKNYLRSRNWARNHNSNCGTVLAPALHSFMGKNRYSAKECA